MNIGQTAKASGISAKMIRYYESVDLIASPHRTGSGYRIYSDQDVQILRFIRRARDLGFKVEDIRDLLMLWRDRSRKSSQVKKVALEHIEELRLKILELQSMVETLQHLADSCSGDQRSRCPIIEELEVGTLRHQPEPPKFDHASNPQGRRPPTRRKSI